jgi:Fe-S-cluster containining protein
MPEKTNACTGSCCAVFTYSVGIPELQRRADMHGDESAAFLVDMLIELSPDEAMARMDQFGVTGPREDFDLRSFVDSSRVYKCRHWDEETRLCKVYEDRPLMCREYPYARTCDHDCACKYTAEKHVINKHAALEVQRAQTA